ncbi:hypothetical protein ACEWY4_010502 [Coilia grayii]|uniref:Mucin-2 n=1 Tax=Coilia grayii TaxID=363190 RepID=A0ABD1K233_9TELE
MPWTKPSLWALVWMLTCVAQVDGKLVRSYNHIQSICSMWGKDHFKTFDGDVYQFPGMCEYNLASDCHSSFQDFSVHVKKKVDDKEQVTVSQVMVTIKDLPILLTKEMISVGEEIITTPYHVSGVLIEENAAYTNLHYKLGLSVSWNRDDAVTVELDSKYSNRTCGLCGDYNDVPVYDEFISQGRQISAIEFGNKQKIHNPNVDCEDPYEEEDEEVEKQQLLELKSCAEYHSRCLHLLLSPAWSSCASVLDPGPYIETCGKDLCHQTQPEDESSMCTTLAEYSRQCSHARGTPPNWRTPTFCAMKCPYNMVFMESGSPCINTCTHKETNALCEEHNIDGCFCPEGTVLDDLSGRGCIPKEQCQCKHDRIYNNSEVLRTDTEECACHEGRWSCKSHATPGMCQVEEGSHITTYDGKTFHFHGNCFYVLSKDCVGSKFSIWGELAPCSTQEQDTCLKRVVLRLMGDKRNDITIQANGKVHHNTDVNLPYSTADLTIFQPSSFHIILQTHFGLQLQVQLVPIMQLYISLDQSFKTQTCGLCGNYNMKLSDDMRSPQGMVEGTAASFANSWKAQSSCADSPERLEDPCSLSVDNEKFAEHWCSLLKDKESTFAKCHTAVNPDTYYKRCKYASCTCDKSEDCLCAVVSSYVRACSTKGVFLPGWRDTVCDKYTDHCPATQTFSYQLQDCQRTCRSLSSDRQACSPDFLPVDGCSCPEGLYLDDSGVCVAMNKCPCLHNGDYIKPGKSITIKDEHCVCTNGKLHCRSWKKIVTGCPTPMQFFNCSAVENTAADMECVRTCKQQDADCVAAECESGCRCPAGLLDDGRGHCVEEHNCPCHHDGHYYTSGSHIPLKCNNCTCNSGRWNCTENKCPSTCNIYGSGHYQTFDDQRFAFNGDCGYVAVQDKCGNAGGRFHIITENVPCGTTGTTCSKSVRIVLGNKELRLSDGKLEEKNLTTGDEIGYRVRNVGLYLVIESYIGLTTFWDRRTTVRVILQPQHMGKVCGLCGNFNGNGKDDFMTQDQLLVSDVLEFANSWKVSSTCPDATDDFDPCSAAPNRHTWAKMQCSIIKGDTFKNCHPKVDPTPYFENCVKDSCACDNGGDCECFCTAVAAYAQACNEAGVCVAWRTPDICPVYCDYYNGPDDCLWHYSPCHTPCFKTCLNPGGICTDPIPNLEGCYPICPEDKPIFDEENQICVERCDGCYINNHWYKPGQQVPTNELCYECICNHHGNLTCNRIPGCCVYNGTEHNENDVIYNVTDNMGMCYYAICINETVIHTNETCISTTPSPQPTTPSTTTPETSPSSPHTSTTPLTTPQVTPSPPSPTPTSTTAPPTPETSWPSSTTSTTTPKVTLETSTPPGPTQTTTPPKPTSTTEKTTVMSPTPGTPSPSPSSPTPTSTTAPPTSSTTGTPTSTPCVTVCEWTEWFDVDTPYPPHGDDETYENIKNHGKEICDQPENITCRAVHYPQYSFEEFTTETRQHVHCNLSFGLLCEHDKQTAPPKKCFDYEIKVLCCTPCATPTPQPPSPSPTTEKTTVVTTTPETSRPPSPTPTSTTQPPEPSTPSPTTEKTTVATTTPETSRPPSPTPTSTTQPPEPSTPSPTTEKTTVATTTPETSRPPSPTPTSTTQPPEPSTPSPTTEKTTVATTTPETSRPPSPTPTSTTQPPEPSTPSPTTKKTTVATTTPETSRPPSPTPTSTTQPPEPSTPSPTTEKTTVATTTPETSRPPSPTPTSTTQPPEPSTPSPTTEKTTVATTTPETSRPPSPTPTSTTQPPEPSTPSPTTEKTTVATTTPETSRPPSPTPTSTTQPPEPSTPSPTTEKTTVATTTPETSRPPSPTPTSTTRPSVSTMSTPRTASTTVETTLPTAPPSTLVTGPSTTITPTETTRFTVVTGAPVTSGQVVLNTTTVTYTSSPKTPAPSPTTEKTTVVTTTPKTPETSRPPSPTPTSTTQPPEPSTPSPTTEKTTVVTTTPETSRPPSPTPTSTTRPPSTTQPPEPSTPSPTTEKTTVVTTTPKTPETSRPPSPTPTSTTQPPEPSTPSPTTEKTTVVTTTPETSRPPSPTPTSTTRPPSTTQPPEPSTPSPTIEKTTVVTTTPKTPETSRPPSPTPTSTTQPPEPSTPSPTTEKTTVVTTTPETSRPPSPTPTSTTRPPSTTQPPEPSTPSPTTEKTTVMTTTPETSRPPSPTPTSTTRPPSTTQPPEPSTPSPTTEKTTVVTTTPKTPETSRPPSPTPTSTTQPPEPSTPSPTTEKTTVVTTTPETSRPPSPTPTSTTRPPSTTQPPEPSTPSPTTEKTTVMTTTPETSRPPSPTPTSTTRPPSTTQPPEPSTPSPTTEKTTVVTTTPKTPETSRPPSPTPTSTTQPPEPSTPSPTTEKTTVVTTTPETSRPPSPTPTSTTRPPSTTQPPEPSTPSPTTEKTTVVTTTPKTPETSRPPSPTPTSTTQPPEPSTPSPTTEKTTVVTTTPETSRPPSPTPTSTTRPPSTTQPPEPSTPSPTTEKTTVVTTTPKTPETSRPPSPTPTLTTQPPELSTPSPTTEKTTVLTTTPKTPETSRPPSPTPTSTTTSQTTPCVCIVNGTQYNPGNNTVQVKLHIPNYIFSTPCLCLIMFPGDVIFDRHHIGSGICLTAICSKICEIERITELCSTTVPTTTTPSTTTTTITPTTPVPGCPEWDKQQNETFWLCHCIMARCIEDNIVEVIPYECPPIQNITCANGKQPVEVWDETLCCKKLACDCYCEGWGDPHYMTFDGLSYSHQGNCTYVLVEEIFTLFNFKIYVDNVKCAPYEDVSCPRSIIISYKSDIITLKNHNLMGPAKLEALKDGSPLKLPYAKNGIRVTDSGLKLIYEIPELEIVVTFGIVGFTVNLPYQRFGNNTQGHCGTCNNNPHDDCMLPDGRLVDSCEVMADFWPAKDIDKRDCLVPDVVPTASPTAQPTRRPCGQTSVCDLIMGDLFAECHPHISPDRFFDGCVFDSCHMENKVVECTSLQIYAEACKGVGVCINWRNHTTLCASDCPANKVYHPCGPVHQPICDEDSGEPRMSVLTEGCFCPEGTKLFSKDSSVCVDKCGCLDPEGNAKEYNEKFEYKCQECVCLEDTRTISCTPKQCQTPSIPSCTDKGFVLVNTTDPSDSCCTQLSCQCDSSTCTPPNKRCDVGYEPQIVLTEGGCCQDINCEVKTSVCVHRNVEYKPGNKVPVADCQECQCTKEKDPKTAWLQVKCSPMVCDKNCEPGYEYHHDEDDEACCGGCVQTQCTLDINGAVHLLEPGSTWSPPDNKCASYSCAKVGSKMIATKVNIECPPFKESNCQPGTIQTLSNGCCQVCQQKDTGCKVETVLKTITYRGCQSEDEVEISHCEGSCNAFSEYFELQASMKHTCTCCRESHTSNRTVTLTCLDGTKVPFTYTHVEDCQCTTKLCANSSPWSTPGTKINAVGQRPKVRRALLDRGG